MCVLGKLKAPADVALREVPASNHFKRVELDSLLGFSSGDKVWIHALDKSDLINCTSH